MIQSDKIALKDIVDFLGHEIIQIYGNYKDYWIDNVASPDKVNKHTLDWINVIRTDKQAIADNSPAQCILVDKEVVYSEILQKKQKVLIVVDNPKLVLAKIGHHFFSKKKKVSIHPTAIICSKVKLGKNVSIGAYSVIGNAIIGDYTQIDSNVHIYDDTIVGNHCNIKSGVVLGGEGFGYEKDEKGNLFQFPQIGKLIIGNYVDIGSNTCIDRGSLSDTVIGDYTKINNLVHIAHNNKIGQNVVITAHVNISGSNIIEDYVWISPNASIKGWIKIGEGAVIGMSAVVLKDIPAGETWVGNPAKKLER